MTPTRDPVLAIATMRGRATAVMLCWLLWILFGDLAHAHDQKRPDLNNWFNSLHSSGGNVCCSDNDGRVVKDVDWESKDGHYRVRIGDKWIPVPDSAIVKVPNLDGRTMVWLWWSNGMLAVSCFMPGTMT